MHSKLSIAFLLGLIVAGATWASNKPTAKTEPVSTKAAGCCVTGDCCCPGQGSCCDPTAKAKAPTAIKAAKKGAGCCVTGDCCCPGQGDCCWVVKVQAKVCCGLVGKKTTDKPSCCLDGGCGAAIRTAVK
jgi:hypothetical protein